LLCRGFGKDLTPEMSIKVRAAVAIKIATHDQLITWTGVNAFVPLEGVIGD
jgi:hypothetical protein